MTETEQRKKIVADTLGFGDNPRVMQVRDYLMVQDDPMLRYQQLARKIEIPKKTERALFIEMRRLGFSEFPVK